VPSIFLALLFDCPLISCLLFSQGAESQIKAKFYSLAFQQVYEEINGDENNAVLKWKIVDYQLAGEVPYY
jgi:hypothetical protein